MKNTLRKVVLIITEIGAPFTVLAALWMKLIKKAGLGKLSDKAFMAVGILPVEDQYYQPLINPKKHLKKSLHEDRDLPGIDLNTAEQLTLLGQFDYNEELIKIPLTSKSDTEFFYNNGAYGSGDAEYLYNMIRHFKPCRIIEIGSGLSTLMTQNAIKQNQMDNPGYQCKHICIEPYEMPWLQKLDIELRRKLVEEVPIEEFQQLQENDILFIDSSHIIRPQGDVLFEYLQLLPRINKGVIVHIHDIFTPKDYPEDWVIKEHRLWNEQYLLEAFLTGSDSYRIIGAVNYLSNHYRDEFSAKCPIYAQQPGREPAAFWMVKN